MRELLLAVRDLDAYYGSAHILQGVEFEVGAEPVSIIGRNGMGKSTLCHAIMGLVPTMRGSIRFRGDEIAGKAPYKIAGSGIGFVPQGRRLFPSLSTDEHLRMLGSRDGGRWSAKAIYDLFPRLAERKRISAAQLSGGEQQMLAIGRALLRNPKLLVMDEPSEGLAPTIVEHLIETMRTLVAEGTGLLLIEQNLAMATSVAERQLVMVAGRIATETTASALVADPDAQQRYLGVTRVEEEA
ncbi:MAG: ABC transporter ATP-binding protein [Thermoleophilia bacterium]|nr:ABC transporter ATP-binding protein [Thermoleophilia bacterium]